MTLSARAVALRVFHQRLVDAGLGNSYQAAHTRLITACLATAAERVKRVAKGKFPAPARFAKGRRRFLRRGNRTIV